MTGPALALEQRITQLLGTHDVHPDDRRVIRDAYEKAASWQDMPADVRALIEQLEQLPRQSWDDPFDVPHEIMNPE